MAQSWRRGELVVTDTIDTIADGIAVRQPVPEALDDLKPLVDDMMLIDDRRILHAMRALAHCAGLLSEPAGAAGLAVVLAHPKTFAGRDVATVVCGSNMTRQQFSRWFAVSP